LSLITLHFAAPLEKSPVAAAIERASVTDLMQVEGISAESARRIYEFFHEGAA